MTVSSWMAEASFDETPPPSVVRVLGVPTERIHNAALPMSILGALGAPGDADKAKAAELERLKVFAATGRNPDTFFLHASEVFKAPGTPVVHAKTVNSAAFGIRGAPLAVTKSVKDADVVLFWWFVVPGRVQRHHPSRIPPATLRQVPRALEAADVAVVMFAAENGVKLIR